MATLLCRDSLLLLLLVGTAVHAIAAEKPNVLLIVSDDLNNDLGCYGNELVQSPQIDRLARRAMRFDRAYCQFPVCNPSRASFMTGLYPEQTTVFDNARHFRSRHPDLVSLGQFFQTHGYVAARVGKIYHYGVPNEIGTDGLDDAPTWNHVVNPRGIDRESHDAIHTIANHRNFGGTLSWLSIPGRDEEHTDGIAATEAIKLLEGLRDKPFFLAVGFYRPHTPYVAPEHHFEKYHREKIEPVMEKPGDRDDIPAAAIFDRPGQRGLPLEIRRKIIQAYYASISLMDAQVGRLLDALERLELDRRTIVVFFSDHGYHLGAKGMWQKSDLFDEGVRVPLIIADPRKRATGQSTESLAELVDIYPTLAELCDLPAPSHLAGISLAPVLEARETTARESAFSVTVVRARLPDDGGKRVLGHTIRTSRYRYTEWGEGRFGTELYDYENDPEEFSNLAGKTEAAAIEVRLKELLAIRRIAGRAEPGR